MNLYCFIELEKARTTENNPELDIFQAKECLEQYTNFSVFRKDAYPGQDKLYTNKDKAIEAHSWPGLLITLELDDDELDDVLNRDTEKDYHYFSKFKIDVVKEPGES